MWTSIITTITGMGIGLSVQAFIAWRKSYLSKKQSNKKLIIESIVLNYIKQLQKNGKSDGNIAQTKKTSKET